MKDEGLVHIDYSIDEGFSWDPVRKFCAPPDTTCGAYDLGSQVPLPIEEVVQIPAKKRRIAMALPPTVA